MGNSAALAALDATNSGSLKDVAVAAASEAGALVGKSSPLDTVR